MAPVVPTVNRQVQKLWELTGVEKSVAKRQKCSKNVPLSCCTPTLYQNIYTISLDNNLQVTYIRGALEACTRERLTSLGFDFSV
jgi:hypothetical protein